METPVVAKEIPDVITDPSTKRTYERGKFLGKVKEKDILTLVSMQGCLILKILLKIWGKNENGQFPQFNLDMALSWKQVK